MILCCKIHVELRIQSCKKSHQIFFLPYKTDEQGMDSFDGQTVRRKVSDCKKLDVDMDS